MSTMTIVGIIGLSLIFNSVFAELISELVGSEGMEFVNPVWLYKRFKVNWFGVACITLIFSAITLPFAVAYWFYKLCKVGRK